MTNGKIIMVDLRTESFKPKAICHSVKSLLKCQNETFVVCNQESIAVFDKNLKFIGCLPFKNQLNAITHVKKSVGDNDLTNYALTLHGQVQIVGFKIDLPAKASLHNHNMNATSTSMQIDRSKNLVYVISESNTVYNEFLCQHEKCLKIEAISMNGYKSNFYFFKTKNNWKIIQIRPLI